jgi:V-type H+-transporting ATPase subunit A
MPVVPSMSRIAQRFACKHSLSYSKYLKTLEPYFEKNTPGFNDNRSTMREILQKDNDLAEIVQLVGKSALSEADKATLEVATMIKVSY